MMVVKKRQVIVIALMIMILIAGYLNWSYQNEYNEGLLTVSDENVEETEQKRLGEAELVNSNVEVDDKKEENKTENKKENDQKTEKQDEKAEDKKKDKEVQVDAKSDSQYFLKATMDKEKARSESIEVLKSVIADPNASKEAKTKAENEIIAITDSIDQEVIIENLIRAKGFKDVVAFINGDKANIVIQADKLIDSDIAKIQDIVMSQAGISADNIKIVPVSEINN